jgi:hypothetical protein
MKILAPLVPLQSPQSKIFIWLFFTIILVLGILIYKDYGISMDEATNRERGIVSLNYIGDLWHIRWIQADAVLSHRHRPATAVM